MKAFMIFLLFLSAGYFSQAVGSSSTDECPYIKQGDQNGEWSQLLASLNMSSQDDHRRKPRGKSKSSGEE